MKQRFQRQLLVVAGLMLATAAAFAQGRPGGGGMGGGGGMRGGGSPMGRPGGGFPGAQPNYGGGPSMQRPPNLNPPGTLSTMRGGLQLGPPGRWWDDRGFAKSLNLRKDQQKKMDAIFNANKGAILDSYKVLQEQELRLESATRDTKLDETKIFAAIDGVNQARSVLEKANAHMLLQVRGEMDADQVTQMERFREKPPEE
jgi:hypothetical protein